MRIAGPGLAFAIAAALAPAGAVAQSGGLPSYEPQQRLRTGGLDTCLKTEVMRDAYCVRKCEAGFRMEFSGRKARCIGLKPDAKYTPPKPAYQPPPPDPKAISPSEGMG